ncbi:nicotinamide/nicotinic acid mononucleotide adenylyltransferase 1-like isoform X2 [Dreissena polymorpha]|uniref:nicotinamide/nicotinic acid mononucleotide adenylyltransferase 1-like isoform X2 n=1 Tax=Dreissena polymorpha TaxID=45954 RepID=UPI00226542CA|nr:nicotinamide/nicotinic acid mononucleotide adenylyltransferase 1-like isoform X2 [Dreissena polymorpha]
MTTTQKVVLLACGSFNPPTNMHLRMFELAKDHLHRTGKYNVIAGIMSPVMDSYGKKELESSKHRCAMVSLALKSAKWVRLDTWETEQTSWMRTRLVLDHHQQMLDNQSNMAALVKEAPSKKRRKDKQNEEVITNCDNKEACEPEQAPVQLKLLCGGDLLESFAVPGLWADEDIEEIVGKYGLVCITRNGSDPRKFIYESDILTRHQDNIHIVTEWITNEVSSTKIRRALRRNESVKYLVQDTVIEYIKEHGLYGTGDNRYNEKKSDSPMSDIMEYLDSPSLQNETITIVTSDTPSKSPKKLISAEKIQIANSPVPMSPRRLESPIKLPKLTSRSASPRRMMEDADPEGERSNSPKTPQHQPCLTDIGTLVRRVRNYNLPGIFQPKKIQPK